MNFPKYDLDLVVSAVERSLKAALTHQKLEAFDPRQHKAMRWNAIAEVSCFLTSAFRENYRRNTKGKNPFEEIKEHVD